jgi:hypothetical protein
MGSVARSEARSFGAITPTISPAAPGEIEERSTDPQAVSVRKAIARIKDFI